MYKLLSFGVESVFVGGAKIQTTVFRKFVKLSIWAVTNLYDDTETNVLTISALVFGLPLEPSSTSNSSSNISTTTTNLVNARTGCKIWHPKRFRRHWIKAGNGTQDNGRLQFRANSLLGDMMYSTTEEDFQAQWAHFQGKFQQHTKFLKYFEGQWMPKKELWDAIFSTNNYVESYHSNMKTHYLGKSRNLRVDRIVYTLATQLVNDYRWDAMRVDYGGARVALSQTTYQVTIENSSVSDCTCPVATGLCKHIFLVSIVALVPYSLRHFPATRPPTTTTTHRSVSNNVDSSVTEELKASLLLDNKEQMLILGARLNKEMALAGERLTTNGDYEYVLNGMKLLLQRFEKVNHPNAGPSKQSLVIIIQLSVVYITIKTLVYITMKTLIFLAAGSEVEVEKKVPQWFT
ncbi:hypothetical protein [Absidia glauca]|uniref:SWIM-type domain-containing protein n=1 Tax=Absidia glauca TaxID=4829 RepID=A0A168L3Y0_ABSGL|nr:hypothetical protein [Absidia glauca]